jgi:hypothetical protein
MRQSKQYQRELYELLLRKGLLEFYLFGFMRMTNDQGEIRFEPYKLNALRSDTPTVDLARQIFDFIGDRPLDQQIMIVDLLKSYSQMLESHWSRGKRQAQRAEKQRSLPVCGKPKRGGEIYERAREKGSIYRAAVESGGGEAESAWLSGETGAAAQRDEDTDLPPKPTTPEGTTLYQRERTFRPFGTRPKVKPSGATL